MVLKCAFCISINSEQLLLTTTILSVRFSSWQSDITSCFFSFVLLPCFHLVTSSQNVCLVTPFMPFLFFSYIFYVVFGLLRCFPLVTSSRHFCIVMSFLSCYVLFCLILSCYIFDSTFYLLYCYAVFVFLPKILSCYVFCYFYPVVYWCCFHFMSHSSS